jgi:SAM-dependent methyltransferase
MTFGFDDLAHAYSASEPPKRRSEIGAFLDWIGPWHAGQALDVASGPATIARMLAPRVKRVFALDLSHAMLSEAGRLEALPANLFLAGGDVEHLPFQEAAFDLVTCAYALANLRDLPAMLRESVRVVARSGRIAFMDVVAPEDSSQCDSLNRLEQMRSEFYTRIRQHSECMETFRHAGLALEKSQLHEGRQRMRDWLRLSPAAADRERAKELRHALLDLGDKAGLRPRPGSDGEVEFCYQTAWFLLRRVSPRVG